MTPFAGDGRVPRPAELSFPRKRESNFGAGLGGFRASARRPKRRFVRYPGMSLELTAFGVIACLFAIIALMPSFDGDWN